MKSNKYLFINTTLFTLLSGFGWFAYEVKKTVKKLSSSVDTGVVDNLDPIQKKYEQSNISKYIYLHPSPEKSPSIIERFWDSLTYTYARRLLNVAQNEDREVRIRAVKSLAEIKNLDNWHYSLLAHMCDAQTAVGLARTKNVDLKFFTQPPDKYVNYNHDTICKWMKKFLISLKSKTNHPCMDYFIDKAFVNIRDVGRMIEHDISSTELAKCIRSADDILPLCVHSILHHSTIEHNARDIVLLNGLPLLMELYKRFKDNTEIKIALAKIMANISLYPELLQDLHKSGWIGILAKFLKCNDIRIQGPAAKALANLDRDHRHEMFVPKIYLLHPIHRVSKDNSIDVVLVHGLLGGVFFTWRQRDQIMNPIGLLGKKKGNESINMTDEYCDQFISTSDQLTREYIKEIEERKKREWDDIGKDFEFVYHDCPLSMEAQGPYSCSGDEICSNVDCTQDRTQCWPKDWLPQDCPNIRVLGINYDTSLSMWAPMCPSDKVKSTLNERSEDFIARLTKVGLGERPIVWISHSMGGLLVKNILVKAFESQDEEIQKLYKQTKGIIFFSTPHRGSHLATLNQTTSLFLWPSIEVRELKEGSPALLKLHDKFLKMLEISKIKIISFVESECTVISPLKFNFHFVKRDSASIKVGEYYEIPLDHLRICKPLNRSSFIYQKITNLIESIKTENSSKS